MKKDTLATAIAVLENQQHDEFELLKKQVMLIYKNIQSVNILKNTIQNIAIPAEDHQLNIIKNIIGVTTAFISKKIFMGKSNNLIKGVVGTFLEVKLANYLSNKLNSSKVENTAE
jgi:hypothetical protein